MFSKTQFRLLQFTKLLAVVACSSDSVYSEWHFISHLFTYLLICGNIT